MAGIDTAAIAFTVAIVVIGVGFTFYMSGVQDAAPVVRAPSVSTETSEPEASSGFGEDLAEKVKAEAAKQAKETVEVEEETMMEETHEEETMMEETHEEETMMEETHEEETMMEETHEEETMMEETHEEETMMEETHEEETMGQETVGPQTHSVEIPVGTSVPGCEETDSCFLPANITINAGDTVEWPNVDTAAHTVTSGSPADGPITRI